MTQTKRFFLNGQEYYTTDNVSIFDLVNYFNYHDSLFVLEYNNFICDKKRWRDIFITNNDKIEIVTIVGGG